MWDYTFALKNQSLCLIFTFHYADEGGAIKISWEWYASNPAFR